MITPEARIQNLEKNLDTAIAAIRNLTDGQTITNDELRQFRIDFDSLLEAIPVNPNVWLKPSELSDMLKISTSTVTKYRVEGLFKKTSVKEVVRGKRTDFYYHRINAVKDISTKRPIQINTNKRILDRFS